MMSMLALAVWTTATGRFESFLFTRKQGLLPLCIAS